jgi:hypothetical protein
MASSRTGTFMIEIDGVKFVGDLVVGRGIYREYDIKWRIVQDIGFLM